MKINVHLSNVHGLGARLVVEKLLEEFFKMDICATYIIDEAQFEFEQILLSNNQNFVQYRRRLPKSVSRVWEILTYAPPEASDITLVLGDMPLMRGRRQIVLFHSPTLLGKTPPDGFFAQVKWWISRSLLKMGVRKTRQFVVQTDHIAHEFCETFSSDRSMVTVLRQPPIIRDEQLNHEHIGAKRENEPFKLFYPARAYSHKNHSLLHEITRLADRLKHRVEIICTVNEDEIGCIPEVKRLKITCIGEIGADRVASYYRRSDALLFLSSRESLGLPLIEAMSFRLPIICPDLLYAQEICEASAFYFSLENTESLIQSINKCLDNVSRGEYPAYTKQMAKFPSNWSEVASDFVRLCDDKP